MAANPLAFASATELAAHIRRREVGCRELLEMYLDRVAQHNPALNAVVVLDAEQARASADAADRAVAHGEPLGPLHGVPTTVKESFDVAGLPTTWGREERRSHRANHSAQAVRRLQAAGAVVFGKTNVPLMLADWQSFNSVYGTSCNPWDLTRTPGGSSGGSAAALAAGLTGLELGSDIGGSLRVPAHYCGVFSHKPTYGIVPAAGHSLGPGPRTDVSVCGPMGRSVGDLTLSLQVMVGAEGPEARAWRLQLPECPRRDVRAFRVAVMLNAQQAEVDQCVQDAIQAAADRLAHAGATVAHARPVLDYETVSRDATLLIRATQSGRMTSADYQAQLDIRRTLSDSDDHYEARYARSITASHREWLQAHQRRHDAQAAWDQFFGEWDLLLCPVASTSAFHHETDVPRHLRTVPVNGRLRPSIEQLFWPGLTGSVYLPSTAVPVGRDADGLPIGMQIVGPQYADLSCLALARWLEQHHQGFTPPPQYA